MRGFAHFLAFDWSGAAGQWHKGIVLGLCALGGGAPEIISRDRPWSRPEVLSYLLEEIPQDTLIGLDLGISLPFADAGAFWLEEPLFVEDIAGHVILRERGNTPIAVGENLHMSYAFENFILRSGAVDFIQPDVARAGGLTEIRKITALAAKHHVPVSFHTWGDGVALAASVHLSAALRDCIVMELDYTYNPLREELLREPFKVENG